jgi:hypothetical protein
VNEKLWWYQDARCNDRKHILCSITFFFENRVVYETKFKNIVELGKPPMTIWCMRIACWTPQAAVTHTHTHTHTHMIYNTYCSSTAKMVARTHPSFTFCVHFTYVVTSDTGHILCSVGSEFLRTFYLCCYILDGAYSLLGRIWIFAYILPMFLHLRRSVFSAR